MSGVTFSKDLHTPGNRHAPRDSLELASLASSSQGTDRATSPSPSSGSSSSRKLSLENEDRLDAAHPVNEHRPLHNRTYSVSSAFDFTANLFPLTSTALGQYAPVGTPSSATFAPNDSFGGGSLEKYKSLTYLNGLSLLVGLIIGSGIFSSPSQVIKNAGSPGASLIVWAVAGVLVWTGAACYAELGAAIPLNGGSQAYLSKIFGEWAGFLFTWCAAWVLKPGSAALISIIFGQYIVRAVVDAEAVQVNVWIDKGVALGCMIVIVLLSFISTKVTTRIGDIFMFFKFLALLGVTVTGVVVAVTGFSWNGKANDEWKTKGWFDGTSTDGSSWARALYAGLWAFDGWDNVNFVVGEFRDPGRDLPRVIHTAMALVILSYILANVAYLFVLPLATIKSSDTIAVQFGAQVFGPVGSLVLALVVSASCFGALNATTFTSGRLVYAAGKEGYLPAMFGQLGFGGASTTANRIHHHHTRRRSSSSSPSSWLHTRLARLLGDEHGQLGVTPVKALLLNACLTTVYILVGEFSTLLTFYGVAGYAFYFLTVLGLIVLRVREPTLDRPYRTYLATPIVFCCVSLFLLSNSALAEPTQSAIVLAFVLAGVLAFLWKNRRRRQNTTLHHNRNALRNAALLPDDPATAAATAFKGGFFMSPWRSWKRFLSRRRWSS